MTITSRQNKLLKRSDKEYYELWRDLGTLEKVSRHLRNYGEINPKLNKPYSKYAIRAAALRYITEYPDEVRQDIEEEFGRKLNTKEWEEFLVRTAIQLYLLKPRELKNWIERKGMKKYSYVYSKRFPGGVE